MSVFFREGSLLLIYHMYNHGVAGGAFGNVFGRSSVLFGNMFAQQLTYYYIQTFGSELMLLMSMIRSWRRMEMIVGHMVLLTTVVMLSFPGWMMPNFSLLPSDLLDWIVYQRHMGVFALIAPAGKLEKVTPVSYDWSSYSYNFILCKVWKRNVPSVFCLEVVWCVKDKVSKKRYTV